MSTLRVPGDVIVLPAQHGRWIVANVFARTAVATTTTGLEVLRAAERAPAEATDAVIPVWAVERFAQGHGLLADPTWFIRDEEPWPDEERMLRRHFVDLCRKKFLLIDDDQAYRARFARKTSLLDREHFGSLHQQLGYELLVRRRVKPEEWWVQQKFDGSQLRNNLYGAVQGFNLAKYFAGIQRGTTVLDVGCGTGFYAEQMAAAGARVIGVDPNADHIAAAKARSSGVEYHVARLGDPDGLDDIAPGSIDLAFMCDALLLYFVPPDDTRAPSIDALLTDIRRVLKPNGVFTVVEPHYAFFMRPWLGDRDRPFTIISEYRNRSFGITGTFGELLAAAERHEFAVSRFEEWLPDPAFEAVDARAYHFAREFPIWHLWEFTLGAAR